MSPEQASGRVPDHRADIFSLGIMLYEMLAGHRPFRGTAPVETLHAIIHDPVPPLPAQPPEIGEILEKALAKDPKDRYQHAGDFALDVRRLRQRPSTARQPAPAPGRSRWRVNGAAAASLLLVAVATTWLMMRPGEQWVNPLENARFTRLTDFDGSELDAALSPDGKLVAFIADQQGLFDAFIGQVGAGDFVNVTKRSGRPLGRRSPTSSRFRATRSSWPTARASIRIRSTRRSPVNTRITSPMLPTAATSSSRAGSVPRRWTCGECPPRAGRRSVSHTTIPR